MTRSAAWRRLSETWKIRTRDRRTLHFRYNTPQEMIWPHVAPRIDRGEAIRLIILKGRRQGISTWVESLMMAFIATGDLVHALVTAHNAEATKRIWGMSKFFVQTSPLLNRMAEIGQRSISFGRSSLTVSTAGSPESQRSADLTAAHLSETAFYQHPEVMPAILQALPPPHVFSIAVNESTANGKVGPGRLFYEEWKRAEEGDSDWVPIFLSFLDFPENQLTGITIEDLDAEEVHLREAFGASDAQLAWRRWAIVNLCQNDLPTFHAEQPVTAEAAFVTSGLPFFRPEHLLPLERHIRRGLKGIVDVEGHFTPSPSGYLEIFVPPKPGHTYVVGSDSSMGISDDGGATHSRSAAEVLDMETLEQVAEYDAISDPHIMARHLAGIGRYYQNALLAPEVQSSGGGGGREVLVYLRDMNYWNIHRWKQPDSVERRAGVVLGWETNARSRPRMLARIREVVKERSATIHSRKLLNQLADFGEKDSGRMAALAGHDDLLFAYGIALMSRSENYFKMTPEMLAPPTEEPDWASYGLRVLKPEDPYQRMQRLIALDESKPREKSFLEY